MKDYKCSITLTRVYAGPAEARAGCRGGHGPFRQAGRRGRRSVGHRRSAARFGL